MIDWNKIVYAGDLLAATFRLTSPVFVPYRPARDYTPDKPTGIKSDGADSFLPEVYSNLRVATVPEAERLSQFGTPVLDSFTFEMGEYNTYKQGALVKTTMPDFLLPYATIVSFTRSMNMTQTKTGEGDIRTGRLGNQHPGNMPDGRHPPGTTNGRGTGG